MLSRKGFLSAKRMPVYFEGVCLTTVILAPGACGGRLRAAPRDIKSPDAADLFQIAHFMCVLSVNTDLDPPRNPPIARHSSGRPWESLGEGLEELWEALAELREALGELWEGLYIQKLPINRPSGRYVSI